MRKTKAIYGEEAREALIRGVEQVFRAVAPTMGAKGKNAIYKKYGMPIVTNDGVSIAREILPEDPYEYLGAETVKQAAEETNFTAGDGTTSTIVFARHLIQAGAALVEAGINPMVLRREIEVGTEKILKALKELSVPVENLEQVAQVSVENDEIAKLVSDIVSKVGVDGTIDVIEAPGATVRAETVDGYTFNSGWTSPYMINTNKGEAILNNPAIIVTDRSMNLNADFVGALQSLKTAGYTSVLLIASEVEGELLQTLLANKEKNVIHTVVVKRPESVHELEDIAAVTGAIAVTTTKDIKDITIDQSGIAEKVIVTDKKTVIIGKTDFAEKVAERIEEVKNAIKAEDEEKYGAIQVMKLRLSRLSGGIARIKVGASTEAEQAYLKMKIDDAVGACKAALQEGIVPGGGTTLRDLANVLNDKIPGEAVLADALGQPYLQILANAGIVLQDGDGVGNFNVLTGKNVDDMMKEGIVDPAKVVRCVIQNGVSTAKTLLTTETAIADIESSPAQAFADSLKVQR